MTSTYTTDLRFTKQGTGDNSGTWGTVANNVFDLIEESIAGLVSINVTATTGNYNLSTANGSTDEARHMILRIGGNPVAAQNVVIPAVSKLYVVECTIGSAVTITVKTNTGSGINMVTGQKQLIYCDGLNTFSVIPGLMDLGVTATAGELNILDGATVTVGELNILDGATLSTAELNILDGATVTVGELNVLDGVTATVAEINILDGATVTVGELNVLDGITVTVGVLNNAITSAGLTTAIGFSKYYESAEQAIVLGSAITLTHSLGSIPKLATFELVCKTADGSYSVDDRVPFNNFLTLITGTDKGLTGGYNATQLFVATGSTPRILERNGSNELDITIASWKIVARAWA